MSLLGSVLSLVLFCSAPLSAQEEQRSWEDRSGEYKIEGTFISEVDEIVTIKNTAGEELEIPLDKLSLKDQIYVRNQRKKADNPFMKKGESNSDSPFSKKSSGGSSSPSSSTADVPEPSSDGRVVDDNFTNARDVEVGAVLPGSERIEIDGITYGGLKESKSIRLPNKTDFFERTQTIVTNAARTHAILGRTLDRKNENKIQSTFILVELDKGRYAGHGVAEGLWTPLDLHPSGKQFLARTEGFGRDDKTGMQLLNLGKQGLESVVTWKPYLHDDKRRDIEWAAFVGEDEIVTLGGEEQLVFWKIPEIEPVAKMKLSWTATPCVTPGGKYVVYHSNGQTGFIDVATHKVVALLDTPKMHSGKLTVSLDGKWLASQAFNKLYVWNLETFQLHREIGLTGMSGSNNPPAWVDGNHILVRGSYLVDLDKRVQLWEYKNSHTALAGDGFCWFFVDQFGNRNPGLVGLELPHAAATQSLESAMERGTYFILQPGSKLKVDASAISDRSKQGEAKSAVENALQQAGYELDENAEVTVKLEVKRGKTEEITYRSFGTPAFSGGTKYSFTPYISSMKFLHKGKEFFDRTSQSSVPHLLHLKQGQSVGDAIKDYEKPNYSFFGSAEIPQYVPRPRDDGKFTLGTTELVVQ